MKDGLKLSGTSSGSDSTSFLRGRGRPLHASPLAAVIARRRRHALRPRRFQSERSEAAGPWPEAADFTLDADGRILSWSASAALAYGYCANEVLGRHLSMLSEDGSRDGVERLLLAARRFGSCTATVRRQCRDGTPVAMQARVIAYERAEVSGVGYAEIDLPASEEQRAASGAAADHLIRLAAHELRAPLGVVLGALTLLGLQLADAPGQGLPEPALQLLAVAQDELRQMDDLLGGILDSWRTKQAELAVRLGPCDLREIVDTGLRPLMLVPGRVQVEAPSWSLPLQGDPARLRQVVRNLVANAVKYSPADSPILLRVDDLGDLVRVSVLDRGIGIAEGDLERIFERHYRGRLQPQVDPGGMGLGLHVCRTIVEAHGGRIWAEQRDGGGACLAFEMPRQSGVFV